MVALGVYNVNSNLETDDGSSRYLLYNNYFVYSTHATDFAMNAHWNYYVGNVHAYGQGILQGWSPANHACSTDTSAKCPPYHKPGTNCYVYNATFYMLGADPGCQASCTDTVGALDTSTIHSNSTKGLGSCVPPIATSNVVHAPAATDQEVTRMAKAALGDYPKPYQA